MKKIKCNSSKKNLILLNRILCAFAFVIVILFSCNKKEECTNPTYDANFSFILVNEFDIIQIAAWGNRYLSDSVYFTKMNGNIPRNLSITSYGVILFKIHEDDAEANDRWVSRDFLLHLPDIDGNPYFDTDTISFSYRFNERCFDSLVIQYNEDIQYNGTFDKKIKLVKK